MERDGKNNFFSLLLLDEVIIVFHLCRRAEWMDDWMKKRNETGEGKVYKKEREGEREKVFGGDEDEMVETCSWNWEKEREREKRRRRAGIKREGGRTKAWE